MEQRWMAVGVVCALALAGCESVGTAAQSKRNQGAVMGGLLGAGTGAIIGNQTGNTGAGTAIGAALGALGGGLMGNALEEQDRKIEQMQYPPATGSTTPTSMRAGQMKFCPVGGEEYADNVKYCPNHGVELKYKEQ